MAYIQSSVDRERRHLAILIRISAAILGVAAGLVAIAVLDRRQIVSYEVVGEYPDPVAPGGIIYTEWRAHQLRNDCDGIARRYLTTSDMRDWQLGDAPVANHQNEGTFVREIALPTFVADGPATYHVEFLRWCNSMQHFIWPIHDRSLPPIHFTIKCPVARDLDGRCHSER